MDQLVISDGTDTATLVPRDEDWILTVDVPDNEPERRQRMLEAAAQAIGLQGGGRLQYWITRVHPTSDRIPVAAGFTPYRDLWRLRRSLPALPTTISTRPFTTADTEGFLDVNNRAFEWHPEQGGLTTDDLAAKQAEAWYDPDGFRIWEHEGRIGGFCWTKVHSDVTPSLGEIYAVAVDPELRGRGLGRELTLTGLAWLSGQGLRHAILYVESDNRPANRVYEDLGFEHEFTSRAYQRTLR